MTIQTDANAAASSNAETNPEVVDPAVVVDPAAEDVTDANPAAPSTVDTDGAKEPASLLDVVKSAVEKQAEPEASPAPEGEQVDPVAEAAAPTADDPAADDANLPFHNHPRWKAVIAERDSLREPAERMTLIETFMQDKGLTSEEVAEGYHVMGLLKGGPDELAQARDWFAERLEGLNEALGHVLPADLQSRVDEGLLDADGAAELAKARAAANLRETQDAQRAARETAAATERDATAKTTAMVGAVEAWETRIKASDPDYSKKAKLVQDRCRSIVASEGKAPQTPEEATALADRALGEINAEFKSTLPKPRPIAPAPAGSSTPATAEPKTLREAINSAVGR